MNLLIFDLDNTLVHSQIDYAGMRGAVIELLHEFGLTREPESALRAHSVGELIARGAAHSEEFERNAWERVLEFERAGMEKSTVEDDAAATLKVLLEQHFKLAILTNNARPATLAALEKFNLLSYFDLILTRSEVPLKPEPEGILRAKSTFSPQKVYHVGDAWLDGVAANRAHVPFIAFRPLPRAFDGREITVWNAVQNLSELPALVGS